MAELGEHVRLATRENGEDAIDIDRFSSRKSVIITRSKKHVCVYDVNDPRPQNSWTTGSGQEIQHGAIIDHTTKQCAAIINQQTIRRWTAEDAAISKGKRFTVPKPAYRLLSHAPLQPLILYADGTFAWLNKANQIFGEPILKPAENILWTEAVVIGKCLIVAILKDNEEGPIPTCFVYNIQEDSKDFQQAELKFTGDLSQCCKCLRVNGARATLLSMSKSTGDLSETTINDPAFGQTKSLGSVPIGSSKTGSICSIGPSHLAVCGVRNIDGKVGIGIWDTKFGILQAWRPYQDATLTENNQVQLLCLVGHLIASSPSGLYAFPFKSKQSTIGASLGKFNTSAFRTKQELGKSTLEEHLEKLIDPKKTGTKKNFNQALNFFLKEWDNSKTCDLLSVQHYLVAIIERLMSDENLWSQDDIQAIINRSLIPTSVCAAFIRSLIKKGDLVLLHLCICHLRDITEAAMIECLSFFLGTEESKYKEITDEEMSEDGCEEQSVPCPYSPIKAGFIGKVLSLPYNDVFLVGHLKKVDFQRCMELLQYLHYQLDTMPIGNMERSSRTLSIIQVVDWINILLDVHFTQLVLSVEARQILLNLHQTVEKNVQFYDELVGLENILSQIKEKCALPQKQNLGLYNIHVLHVY